MIRHCRGSAQLSWLGDVIVGLGYTGMRIGELTMLRWSAIDLDRNMISVVDDSRSTRSRRDNARSTKSSKSRSIPIHLEFRDTLERLQKPGRAGLVFTALRGGQLHPRNVLQAFIDDVIGPLQQEFPGEDGGRGFASGRLHSLRHYFCSWCANAGVSERVLMTWLGHGSSAMVKRYYHLCDDEAQSQMKKLGRIGGLGTT
jgi:integrase